MCTPPIKKEVKMTIRKLTVAAAIAVGIATCSFNTVMAANGSLPM